MRILLSIFVLFSILITIRSAPKLGPLSFEPLIYEAKLDPNNDTTTASDSDEWLTANLRSNDEMEKTSSKPCLGYDYDVSLCKIIKDRQLCGYNKNKGEIQTEVITDIGNGCRMKGDRLECGYLTGPFNLFSRRPPPNEENVQKPARKTSDTNINVLKSEEFRKAISTLAQSTVKTTIVESTTSLRTKNNTSITTSNSTLPGPITNSISSATTSLHSSPPPTFTSIPIISSSSITTVSALPLWSPSMPSTSQLKVTRYCVEKDNQIFCYTLT